MRKINIKSPEIPTLSRITLEKLQNYVYLLIDPRNDSVFYVGRGKGGRILDHLKNTIQDPDDDSLKRDVIKQILNDGKKVQHSILRHGLDEVQACEVEAAVIDLMRSENLSNLARGAGSEDRGLMTLEDIQIKYNAEPAVFAEPILLININRQYKSGMNPEELLNVTKGDWKINPSRASKFRLACCVFRGVIREIFEIGGWDESKITKGRYVFRGTISKSAELREKYLYKTVQQSQNPVRYVGEVAIQEDREIFLKRADIGI